jgi:uncharacterized protein with gpF-like domain
VIAVTLKSLGTVRPNAGIEAVYRKKLKALVNEMFKSVMHWVRSAYNANEPVIAQDELPASALKAVIDRLTRQWQRRFGDMSKKMAKHFAMSISKRTDAQLAKILRDGGFTLNNFAMTRAQRDIINATVNQNVALIKSIPQKFLGEVEGMVMRSVQTGRDLGQLSDDLRKQFGVTKRRAALIARDQNNKATSALINARYQEVGIAEAIWVHSTAGKEPRPTHLAAGMAKTRYKCSEGWFDPHEGRHIFPGELINCRCVSRPVVVGFS